MTLRTFPLLWLLARLVLASSPLLTILAADLAPPVVWLELADSRVREDANSADPAGGLLRFRIHREGSDMRDLQVFLHTEGVALSGVDFEALPLSIHLPAGQRLVDVTIRPIDDSLSEGEEQVICILDASPSMGPIEPYRVDPDRSIARGLIVDDEPLLQFQEPAEGQVFAPGDEISIRILTVSETDFVSHLEFLANGVKIGDSVVSFIEAPPPGTPVVHEFVWVGAPIGVHHLTVRTLRGDVFVESSPVSIQVGGQAGGPRLSILTPENGATVPVGQEVPVVVVGVGRLGGITDVALLVDGKIVGESHLVFIRPPEVDEEVSHNFSVRFEPGQHQLTAIDLTDRSVVSPPITVLAGKAEAGIAWVNPPEGAVFPLGAPIPLEVQAVDPAGNFFVVDFFDGEVRIGTSEYSCPTCRLAQGAVISHSFEWVNAGEGAHFLTARATRGDGTVVSSPRRSIIVTADPNPDSFVTRDLPDSYQVETPFTVQLETRPDSKVAAYVVEERPPFTQSAPEIPGVQGTFWKVTSISHNGVFDPQTGKVKFGPFFDHEPRTLTYQVIPSHLADVATFDGVGVADGKASPIGGDRELRGSLRHPADRQPANDAISAGELTAYAAAWKREEVWPDGPNPIPLDYVTRAAVLWQGGESYWYDPSAGLPPFCWVNAGRPVPTEDRAATGASLAGVALREVVPQGDGSLRVTLHVMAAPGTRAFALEERLPASATVSEITGGGEWTAASHVARWGPFFIEDAPVISYGVSGLTAERTGLISFDGQSIPIRDTSTGADGQFNRLIGVDLLHDGSHQVSLEVGSWQQGAEYELQISSDLKQWSPVGTFSSGEEAGFARDAGAAGDSVRFYRAIRRQ